MGSFVGSGSSARCTLGIRCWIFILGTLGKSRLHEVAKIALHIFHHLLILWRPVWFKGVYQIKRKSFFCRACTALWLSPPQSWLEGQVIDEHPRGVWTGHPALRTSLQKDIGLMRPRRAKGRSLAALRMTRLVGSGLSNGWSRFRKIRAQECARHMGCG